MDLGRFTQGGTRWREFALGYCLSGFQPLRIETGTVEYDH